MYESLAQPAFQTINQLQRPVAVVANMLFHTAQSNAHLQFACIHNYISISYLATYSVNVCRNNNINTTAFCNVSIFVSL